jgi:hypothetical protein
MDDEHYWRPDRFFTVEQIRRLRELMDRFHKALDAGTELPVAEQKELRELVDQELQGMIERSREMFRKHQGNPEIRSRPSD